VSRVEIRAAELTADHLGRRIDLDAPTVDALGYNVIILFPTDFPAGPSTTLYVGRVVYTVDAAGVFRIQTHSGPTTDICAALS
jgi:hypothetical protein